MDRPARLATIADRATLDAAHRRSRRIAAEWLRGSGHRRAIRAFDAAGAQPETLAPDALADAAAALLGDDRWIAALFDPLVTALAGDPWFQPPFRVSRDGLRIGAVLIDHPLVSVSASILSADMLATLSPPATIVVPGRLSIVRFWRGGGARLRLWRTEPADADFSAANAGPCRLAEVFPVRSGDVRRIDGRVTAQLIDRATADVVTITATIRAGAAPFMREYALPDGRLVRIAALDDRASRMQMLCALLREAGYSGAGGPLEQASHDPAPFVRWAAMREWLALDAAATLPRLREMAADPNAEVALAAAQMIPRVEAQMACRG